MSKKAKKQQPESDDYSDVDLDLDLESVAVGKSAQEIEMELDDLGDTQKRQDMEDSDDDDQAPRSDGNKLGVLYDMLLTRDQIDEAMDEWDYKGFIKEFADEEAANNIPDDLAAIAATEIDVEEQTV